MAELSFNTQKYLQKMISYSQSKPGEEALSKIHVDHVASRVATLYEKLRQVIDFQEEHLLRKNAIERILKRRLFLNRQAEDLSQSLVFELIRGGYFPNDRIPEIRVEEIKKILEKYIFLLENIPADLKRIQKNLLSQWLQCLAACEIEETLSPPLKERALLEYMVQVLHERIKPSSLTRALAKGEDERSSSTSLVSNHQDWYLQIFIACQKALLKSDKTLISYQLFKYYLPNWSKVTNQELYEISKNIISLKEKNDKEFNNPLGKKIFQLISHHTASFLIIGDIISENPTEVQKFLVQPEVLEEKLLAAYNKRHKLCKAKIRRSGWRSVISILLSKMALAFLIEIPFDMYVTKKFSLPTLGVNLIFPPALMFVIVSSIRPPRPENAPKVVMESIGIIQRKERPEIYEVRLPKKRSLILNTILALIFLIVSGGVFLALIYGLLKIDFSILSIVIFFIFFCLIAFSGIKTQQWARELKIGEEKEGLGAFLVDFFFFPFVRAGKWLSIQFQKYNILILLLNLFFEAPLQTFFELLEAWRGYIKEKKEEME